MSRPRNLTSLKMRVQNLENKDQVAETRRHNLLAQVALSQLLPDGVVKGGSAMALRYGQAARMTKDLDSARKRSEEEFLVELERNLATGWQGFTGTIKRLDKRGPTDIPDQYIMAPFDIKS